MYSTEPNSDLVYNMDSAETKPYEEIIQRPLKPKPNLRTAEKLLFDVLKDWSSIVVCGGWVRDHLLEVEPNDIDFLVSAHEFERLNIGILSKLLYLCPKHKLIYISLDYKIIPETRYGAGFLKYTFKFEIIRNSVPNKKREVTFDIKSMFDGETLRGEPKYRDFKINCLFYDFRTGMVLGRKQDFDAIDNQILSPAFDLKNTIQDPVRLLRAVRFKHHLDLDLSDDLKNSLRYSETSWKFRAKDPKLTRFHLKRKLAIEYQKIFSECDDPDLITDIVQDLYLHGLHMGPTESTLLRPSTFGNIFFDCYPTVYELLMRWTVWDCEDDERHCLALCLIFSISLVSTVEEVVIPTDSLQETFSYFFQEDARYRAKSILDNFSITSKHPTDQETTLSSYMWFVLKKFSSEFRDPENSQHSKSHLGNKIEESWSFSSDGSEGQPQRDSKSSDEDSVDKLQREHEFWLDYYQVDDPVYWMYGSVKDWTADEFAYADHINMGGY